jgi:hypothetical protein
MSTPKLVPMLSPDGQAGQIPEDRLQEALKAGFKQGVLLQSPQGHLGVVPLERGAEAMKQGFIPAPSISGPAVPSALQNNMPADVSGEEYATMSPDQRAAFDAKVRSARISDLPGDVMNELAGAGKGALSTLAHIGELGTKYLDPSRYAQIQSNLKANPQLAEENKGLITPDPGQKAGYVAEQAAEFLAPSGAIGKVGKAAEALPLAARIATRAALEGTSAAAISAAHGDEHPLATGLVGAAGGAATEALPAAAEFATGRARQLYSKALAPTTNANKNLTEKIVPELLDQGEWGGLKTLSGKAQDVKAEVGPQIDAALQAKGNVPQPVKPVLDSLDEFKQSFVSSNGTVLNQGAVDAAEKLQSQLLDMSSSGLVGKGGYVSTKDLVAARRVWDTTVARAGGFTGKTLAEGSMADAMAEGANSIRRELASANPDLAALNAKYSFWSNVQRVSDATLQRRTGQIGGLLGDGVAELGGALVDGAAGGVKGAVLNVARKTAISPASRTARAVMWGNLGRAIEAGRFNQASKIAKNLATAATSAAQEKDADQ